MSFESSKIERGNNLIIFNDISNHTKFTLKNSSNTPKIKEINEIIEKEASNESILINESKNIRNDSDLSLDKDVKDNFQIPFNDLKKDCKCLYSKTQDYRNMIAGFFGSAISRTIVAPLDRLKMLYQVNYVGKSSNPPSLIQGLINIKTNEGYKGFWKGNLANVIKGSPEYGIKLYTFELIKWKIQCFKKKEKLSKITILISGSISGVVSTSLIFPLEVLKLRIASAKSNLYSGYIDACFKIIKEPGGIKNFYSGLEASIFSVIPNTGLNLFAYESLKIIFSGSSSIDNASKLNTQTLVLIGGLSTIFSSTILYPFQIIQSRMIMDNLNHYITNKSSKFKFINTAKNTLKVEGVRGFFKGYIPGITKITLGNAFGLGIYEKLKIMMKVNKT